MLKASVIISYYKNIPALELILLSLNQQQTKAYFEVIVSEDDKDLSTLDYINKIKHLLNYPLIHVSQEDIGFNKCACLNKAIMASKSDFLIFIDGDCIPHEKFVDSYLEHARPNAVLYGRRVMLSKTLSKKILYTKQISIVHFFSLLAHQCKRIEDGIFSPLLNRISGQKKTGILLGCNMGINKKHLLDINGFDEDYTFPGGGEDSDIEWRLKKLENIEFVSVRFLCIVYHLWHNERFNKEKELLSTAFMNQKIQLGYLFCKNGLQK
jgi:glycosyltransferase involved in cell wall biosynthesis